MLFRRKNKSDANIIDHKHIGQLLQHLGMIAQQVDQGIAVVDSSGTIRFVNTPWAKMHGYNTSNELLGKHISIFHTHEQVQAELNPLINETRFMGWSNCVIESLRVDGAAFLAHLKMSALKNDKGKTIGFTVITTDITGRKHLEDTAIESAKIQKELKEQIGQLQHNIHEHEQTEKRIKQQAGELIAANDKLKQEINDYEVKEESFKQKIAELKTTNEQLKEQLNESKKAREILKGHFDKLKNTLEEKPCKTSGYNYKQKMPGANTDNIDPAAMPIQPYDGEKIQAIVDLVNRLR